MKPSAAPKKKRVAAKTAGAGQGVPEGAGAADDALPGREEIDAALAALRRYMESHRQERVRLFLERLRPAPPQVLLFEGGTAEDRLAAAHYWALLLNCAAADPPSGKAGLPCCACSQCIRMLTHMHRDCFFFDGRSGSIKIGDVRAVRAVLGEPAREARRRMVIFCEAQFLVAEAANALLKSLEEPQPGTAFALLAPQREALLPTLTSRSLVLTLPWPNAASSATPERLVPWEAALCSFLRSGRDFFERSAGKGAVDAPLARELISLCRRALVRRLSRLPGDEPPADSLEARLALLPPQRLRMLDEALAECQDSLLCNVNPALVVEWLATRLYLLLPRASAGRRGR
jgi:DNA polymerase-3 subunit delta'